MNYTPVDLVHLKFKSVLKGYAVKEVDDFKEKVLQDYENLLSEKSSLEQEVKILQERLKDYSLKEKTLESTLMLAERTAEDRITASKKEADLIIEEANLQAKKIKGDAEKDIANLKEEVALLKRDKENLYLEVKLLLSKILTAFPEMKESIK